MTNFIVLDTETAGSVNYPIPYDVGYKVITKDGKILAARSFCVYEIYCLEKDMMTSAYYANKLPQYEQELKEGKRKIARFFTIKKQVAADMADFNVSEVFAYNMNFDRRALNNGQSFTTKNRYRYFFPKDTTFSCIWNMACQVLLARPSYIKYAIQYNFISPKGNILTNAECCYRYLTKNPTFEEQHKGLDDVNIETEILLACFRQHKKMDRKPYTACWRLVQKKRAEMEEKSSISAPGPQEEISRKKFSKNS